MGAAVSAVPRPRAPTPLDDEQLALAAAGGDADAFAELYARFSDRVYARVTNLVGPGPDREDVLQQIFLELHRALPRFRGESTVSTFLYRIAIHVIYDHLRKRTRRAVDHDAAALDALIDGAPSPEERARRRQQLALIFTLLERIKPKKRIAFVLVAIEGLSLDEAAEIVGTNPEAVKQRVLHARRELVALLDRAERRTAPRTGGSHE
jgi:RNA polymerase sigma-70 factor (ECF subfamily)